MSEKVKVAVLIPPAMRQRILSPEAEARLASFAEVVSSQNERLTSDDLPALVEDAKVCITGWGSPSFSDELLQANPQLGLIAHTAGSVRHLIPEAALERGLRISHAAAIIADAVAEFVIAQALLLLRQVHLVDRDMRAGQEWGTIRSTYPGHLLGSRVVGVVGTGRVGQAVIKLLRAFGCTILAYDPYLTPELAADLGVESVELDELFRRSDLVTLHAPVLPETIRMITAQHLASMRDGAYFINAARSVLVDDEALQEEIESGRLQVALDVFEQEPLPLDSPMRQSKALISPHLAGQTVETYLRQGDAMVDEVHRFLTGEQLRYEIKPEVFTILA